MVSEKSAETMADPGAAESTATAFTSNATLISTQEPMWETVGPGSPEDEEIARFLAPYSEQVRKRANRVVGHLKQPMDRGVYGSGQSAIGNFVADAMVEAVISSIGAKPDLCFTNSGGLRQDLPEGPITEGQIIEVMPFDNSIVVFRFNGHQLNKLAERIARRGDPMSGMRYQKRSGRPENIQVGGHSINPEKMYTVCTNDYLFDGGGGYGFDGAENPIYTGVLLRDAMLSRFRDAAAEKIQISGELDGRVQEVSP